MDAIDLPLPHTSARIGADEVFAVLMEAISTGRLRAGQRLPSEETLAAHFQVASMTLRQALARLREAQYVSTRRGRNGGTYVASDIAQKLEAEALEHSATIDDLRVLTDWRRAVSGEASYLAALRGTAAERAELRRLEEDYLQVIDSTTDRRFADSLLHIHIAEMSGNPRLVQAEREIQEQLTRFIRVTAVPGATVSPVDMDHAALTAAILSGQPEAARSALLEHVEVTYFWGMRQPHIAGHSGDEPVPTDISIKPGDLDTGLGQRPGQRT